MTPWSTQERSGRTSRETRRGFSLLAWSPASSPTLPADSREGLRESCGGPRRASGPPPCRLHGPDRPGRAGHGRPAARAGWRPESCPWCQALETAPGCGSERGSQQPAPRLLNKTWLSLSDVPICRPWNFIIKRITLFHTVSFSQPIMLMVCVRQNYFILLLFQRQGWRKCS